jgi:hypothetical protein
MRGCMDCRLGSLRCINREEICAVVLGLELDWKMSGCVGCATRLKPLVLRLV